MSSKIEPGFKSEGNQILDRLAKLNAIILDPVPLLMDKKQKIRLMVDGNLTYFDEGHLSAWG